MANDWSQRPPHLSIRTRHRRKQKGSHWLAECVGLLWRFTFLRQLIECAHGNQATPLPDGLPPRIRCHDCLGSRLNRPKPLSFAQVFREERDQAPTCQHHLSFTRFPALPDDGWRRGGCDVVIRIRHRHVSQVPGCMKPFGDLLFGAALHISSAHSLSRQHRL